MNFKIIPILIYFLVFFFNSIKIVEFNSFARPEDQAYNAFISWDASDSRIEFENKQRIKRYQAQSFFYAFDQNSLLEYSPLFEKEIEGYSFLALVEKFFTEFQWANDL